MRHRHPLLLAICVVAVVGALAASALTVAALPPQEQDAIVEVNERFEAAVAAGDAAAAADLYTEDAMFMAPNAPSAVGIESIREHIQGMLDAGVGSLELDSDEIEVHGDTAHEIGRYVLETGDGEHLDHGKYIVIWKQTADGWKLHRDIFNSDMAPPQPEH